MKKYNNKTKKKTNSKENLKQKVPYQIEKSKAQTHQTNGKQLS